MSTKEDIEFQGVDRRTPYQAPDGFFESLAEKTLQKAKLREHIHRKKIILWKSMAVAASLAAIVLIGYLTFELDKPESQLVVQEKQAQTQPSVEPKSEILKEPAVAIAKVDTFKKRNTEVKSAEDMADVLTDLSDEELLQLAAVFKADPFIEDAVQ